MQILRKNLLSLFVILSFVFYALYKFNLQNGSDIVMVTPIKSKKENILVPETPKIIKPIVVENNIRPVLQLVAIKKPVSVIPKPVVLNPGKVLGKYKDGTFTGPVTDAYYGDMQVQIVASGGRIVKVNVLQHPSERPRSIQINGFAMPVLQQEVLQAQSGSVDAVSGASYSSPAFIESVSAAIAMAKN